MVTVFPLMVATLVFLYISATTLIFGAEIANDYLAVLDAEGRFTAVQQAAGTPKGRPAGAQYLRAFIEDVKATGLVARLIEKNRVRGLTVASPA